MRFVFQLFLTVFVCEIICQIGAANKEEDAATSSVTREAEVSISISASTGANDAGDGKQQEIESKEAEDLKPEEGDSKQESSTESARGDSTTDIADTDRKIEPTTPSAEEKPRDSEEGTVVEANPNPPPQAPQPVDPFLRPTVVYNIPGAWPPVNYPSYPTYPSYPGYEFGGYPGIGLNPWLQQRVNVCPPGFTLVYSRVGEGICRRANIFHNFYAPAPVL